MDDGTKVRVSKRSGAIIPRPEILKVGVIFSFSLHLFVVVVVVHNLGNFKYIQ